MATSEKVDVNALRFVRDIGISQMTASGYKSALSLFDHFLVSVLNQAELENMHVDRLDAEAEDILRGYSLWLCDTNIPKNHNNPNREHREGASYMAYSGLREYLSKTILVLKDILPDNPFLMDQDELDLISGDSFKKRCMRSQMKKSDTFGVESKIGLYRVARHGRDASGTPHWSCLINCDEICKNMMYATKTDDTYNDLTSKRLALLFNKHAVGRGGEFRFLNVRQFSYNPFEDCLDTLWKEAKTLQAYSCPFVPNKYGYATDVYHALGCWMAAGNGLFRQGDDEDKRFLFARSGNWSGSGASRWLTDAIRKYLPDEVPVDQRNCVSSTSARIAGITEMASSNVGYFASHARSGHVIDSNQKNYVDKDDVYSSLVAAKCLAGWDNFYESVSF